jgi:hypothetical protein
MCAPLATAKATALCGSMRRPVSAWTRAIVARFSASLHAPEPKWVRITA